MRLWILAASLAMTASSASAFSFYGPLTAEDWQTDQIGYRQALNDEYGRRTSPADIGTPRNLGEEYRWNTPFLYYAFDRNFLDYFGSNGVVAVEQAMAILNGLTNVSSYSQQLSEVPLDSTRMNFRASALQLIDMKSWTLSIVLEELGLANAERWTWALHDRVVPGGAMCPVGIEYLVVHRNFDPVTFEPSSYVNGTLFTYQIVEECTPAAGSGNTIADAYEVPVDPVAASTAVASYGLLGTGLFAGAFYTGLTRDDVGGLRYLMRTNNVNFETADSFAVQTGGGGTNGSFTTIITTSNLADLVTIAATNTPAQLQVLFPDLVISSSSTSFQLVVSSNTIAYFTNLPSSFAGSPATLVVATVFTTNFQQRFTYTFENVVTNAFYTNGIITIITTNTAVPPGAPAGFPPQTTVSTQNRLVNFINGEYFIVPTNICSFEILTNLLTQVTQIQTTVTATNATATNINGQAFSQTIITYFTNHILLVRFTPCPTTPDGGAAAPALRQGIEKITFIRSSYDSLLGQFFAPITTNYSLQAVAGNQIFAETFRRTITRPDILFTASDQTGTPTVDLYQHTDFIRSPPNFVALPNPDPNSGLIAGPGIIQAPASVNFNKGGTPLLRNIGPFFVGETSATENYFYWGTYDGTTNAPVVFPSGTSIQSLENQVLMQITPASLPDGTVGFSYSVQLNGAGGQPPYSFSLSPGSPGLPPGLSLSSSGLISGVPQFDDTFDFVVRLMDSGARQVDTPFSITISQ